MGTHVRQPHSAQQGFQVGWQGRGGRYARGGWGVGGHDAGSSLVWVP